MTKTKFIRRVSKNYSKLGRRRKKKQIWRKPTGRDNKMREQRRGYPVSVSIGYKKPATKSAVIIKNIQELEKADKKNIIIIGNIGKRKKIELINKAKELKIEIRNINIKKFLKKNIKKKEKEKESDKTSKKKTESEKPKEDTLKGTSKK